MYNKASVNSKCSTRVIKGYPGTTTYGQSAHQELALAREGYGGTRCIPGIADEVVWYDQVKDPCREKLVDEFEELEREG